MLKLLFLSSVAFAQIKKTENIRMPIGDNASITWGDITQLNWKLNAAFISFFVFVAIELYRSYQKSKDTTSADIKEMKNILTKVASDLQHRPTNEEVTAKIREELRYADALRRKQEL